MLHLGRVEDVVDEALHGLAGDLDDVDLFPHLRGQAPIRQQDLRHPEDAVQGRANLVAHHREELGLGLERPLEADVDLLKLAMRPGDLRAAATDPQHADNQQDHDQPGGDQGAGHHLRAGSGQGHVAGQGVGFEFADLQVLFGEIELGRHQGGVLGRHEGLGVAVELADDLKLPHGLGIVA